MGCIDGSSLQLRHANGCPFEPVSVKGHGVGEAMRCNATAAFTAASGDKGAIQTNEQMARPGN